MNDAEYYTCTICGQAMDLNADQMVEHFDTMHPFLAALVHQYAHFDDDDPRGLAWLN